MTTNTEPARILVIDDNPAIHDDFRKVFRSASSDSEMDEIDKFFFDEDEAQPKTESIQYEQADAFQGHYSIFIMCKKNKN